MKRIEIILPVIIVLFTVWAGVNAVHNAQIEFEATRQTPATPQGIYRIVSLAPSITESLFAVGLGDRVVGVTRYCQYPASFININKIGGFLDPNYEAILRLQPDLVITGDDSKETLQKLESLGLRTLVIRQKTIDDILSAMMKIGDATGQHKEAALWVENTTREIKKVKQKYKSLKHPKVLVSMTRVFGEGTIHEVYVAGERNFYNDLILLAGGVNAYDGAIIKTPSVSAEGIIDLNPDVILDLMPMSSDITITPQAAQAEWQSLQEVSAVKNNRVYVLTGDYTVVPGPRLLMTLTDFVAAIHPEILPEMEQ
jgi:iron complex transport system substrate-binding protein